MSPGSYDDLIGKPYELGGMGPETYDCFGLASEVLQRMGFPIDHDLASHWIRQYKPGEVDISDLTDHEVVYEEAPRRPGDLLVMRHPDSEQERATHVAVLVSTNLVIQATKKLGVHIIPFSKVEPYTVEVITWK